MSTAIARIFKTTDFKIAASAFEDVGETPDEWFLWIDENAPREYQNPEYLARAYEMISMADVFKGRISNFSILEALSLHKAIPDLRSCAGKRPEES